MHEFEGVALRLGADSRDKIQRANWAVLEAIYSFKGHETAQSPALLGMSEVAFRHVIGLPLSERHRLGNVGVPIWATCIEVAFDRAAPADGVRVSVENQGALEGWAATATGISVGEIRKANRAILEAILSFRDCEDPAATFLLGIMAKRLEALHCLKSRDVQKVCLGNLPFWRARFEIAPDAAGKTPNAPVLGRDHLMRTLMKELGAT
jgi:hypothetical protein